MLQEIKTYMTNFHQKRKMKHQSEKGYGKMRNSARHYQGTVTSDSESEFVERVTNCDVMDHKPSGRRKPIPFD
jgi:hypothetical protein